MNNDRSSSSSNNKSHTIISTQQIDLACKAFQKSVSAYIIAKSRNRHNIREHIIVGENDDDDDYSSSAIIELVHHANHVLRTLNAKRLSLKNALLAFREASDFHVKQFRDAAATTTATTAAERQRILRNWFANYIRLRDGFVLLESGERRHPHDGDDVGSSNITARKRNPTIFQSKLNGAYRSDGITRKFSSKNGYTGTGYDEVYDEDVGIKRRLLEALSNNIDCCMKDGQKKRRSVERIIHEQLFDGEKYGNGAQLWESCMDEHIRESHVLRDTLHSIQVKFVNDINTHLLNNCDGIGRRGATTAVKKMKLTLITDDKFERMTLGDLVDIARQGNAFTLQDAGGSLPIGMTVHDWRQKFGLIPAAVAEVPLSTLSSSSRVEKVALKKKRKIILEDSSEEEEEEEEEKAAASSNKAIKTKQLKVTPNISSDPTLVSTKKHITTKAATTLTNDDDGLTVRMRKATDVSKTNQNGSLGENHVNNTEDITSIDDMKRQLGVNNAELERGRELLENEQLLSRIAADEEDMREEIMLRDGNNTSNLHHHDNKVFSNHATLLRKIYSSRNELRKNKNALSYMNSTDIELLSESQEYWAAFDESVLRWNDQLQSLGEMRKDVSDGRMDDFSDRAYTIRENFREANMLLGIDAMEVYEFYSQLEKKKPTTQNRLSDMTSSTSSSSSLHNDPLFDVSHSCLTFAQETFKTALSLVLEHERYCQTDSPVTIDRHWEKGQHLLLRGRAHHNIGHAIYERAEYTNILCNQQRPRGKNETTRDLLLMAREEFAKAVQRARSIRHNTVMIYGHPNANETSSQSNYTWVDEATIHKLEAMKLELLASGFHILCSWKVDNSQEEAMKTFNEIVESVEIPDVLELASAEGVSPVEVLEVLTDMYWHAMRVAELSTQSLECLSNVWRDWNVKRGEELLQLMREAMQRASVVSEHLHSFVNLHSLYDYMKDIGIATPADITKEEREICQWWETIKKQATTRLSDIANNTHRDATLSTLQRGEIASGISVDAAAAAPPPTRRVFVRDDRALQDRTLSCRSTRRVMKKISAEDERNVAEQFSSEFAPTNDVATADASYSNRVSASYSGTAKVVYRKWGNEILEPHERKPRCCPPLPENFVELGISIDVIRALEKKLENILPAGHQFH